MARQAVPKRPAPADTTLSVHVAKAGSGTPFEGIIKDITTGSQQLLHMTKAAAATVRERYNRMKAFVGDR